MSLRAIKSYQIKNQALAQAILKKLQAHDLKFVLAESCTGGTIAATFAQIPGVSSLFCGSQVVYQNATKTKWLKISPALLKNDGAVSARVATEMATRILKNTPAAQIAAAITGHLGPDAPPGKDGLIYIAVAKKSLRASAKPHVFIKKEILPDGYKKISRGKPAIRAKNKILLARLERQLIASHSVLLMVRSLLD